MLVLLSLLFSSPSPPCLTCNLCVPPSGWSRSCMRVGSVLKVLAVLRGIISRPSSPRMSPAPRKPLAGAIFPLWNLLGTHRLVLRDPLFIPWPESWGPSCHSLSWLLLHLGPACRTRVNSLLFRVASLSVLLLLFAFQSLQVTVGNSPSRFIAGFSEKGCVSVPSYPQLKLLNDF